MLAKKQLMQDTFLLQSHDHHTMTFDSIYLLPFYIHAVAPVKISESPASNTAIVEHLYSFPQAVPSSICDAESV